MMSAAYRHCVNGLLTSIVWTLIARLYDVYITDIVYLLDVLVVIVYMSYCNCWDYLLLHEDWGECSEDWAGACRWGGEVEYLTENFFSLRNVPGGLKTPKQFFFFSKMFLGFWNACKQMTRYTSLEWVSATRTCFSSVMSGPCMISNGVRFL